MALPHAKEARLYYQIAKQRFLDAQFLLENDRTTGAIYLAGYGAECMLKALILSMVARKSRPEIMATFRGEKGHDIDWLKGEYFARGGPPFPKKVSGSFAFLGGVAWGPDTRYFSGTVKWPQAKAVLDTVEEIMLWADGRM